VTTIANKTNYYRHYIVRLVVIFFVFISFFTIFFSLIFFLPFPILLDSYFHSLLLHSHYPHYEPHHLHHNHYCPDFAYPIFIV
ncbi:hypothetical protein VIGAN_09080500, partial [Vigna angularis var. angularis]